MSNKDLLENIKKLREIACKVSSGKGSLTLLIHTYLDKK